jgi:hypothetical protein
MGFIEHQANRIRAARRIGGSAASVRVAPFPYVPSYSLRELGDLEHRIWEAVRENNALRRKLVGLGLDVQSNLVDVGVDRGQVKIVTRLLRERLGPNEPIRVHFEEAPVEV